MTEFISQSTTLIHLDLTAMNLSRESTVAISQACVKSETLAAVHLSDNGIRTEQEWTEEVLDVFGLSMLQVFPQQELGLNFINNMRTKQPKELRDVIVTTLKSVDKRA